MRISNTLPGVALGLALALGACGGGADAESEGEEEASSAAADHDPNGYAIDTTGMVASEIGENALDPVNAQLAANHAETGSNIHLLYVNDRDSADDNAAATAAMTAAEADAIIYINVGDEAVTVTGEGIDEGESSAISTAMIAAFDEENFADGMTTAIDSTIAAMAN